MENQKARFSVSNQQSAISNHQSATINHQSTISINNDFLILFSLMPDFSIGVDLGGTNLRIAAVSTDGQLLEKITLGVKGALGRDHVIGEMCDAIQRLTEQYRGGGKFVGVGIGVPGIIDMESGMMRKSANLPGWALASCSIRTPNVRRFASNGWAQAAALPTWR